MKSPIFTIVEQPNLKTSEILNMCKKLFKAYSSYNDKQLDEDYPAPKEATVRYFRANIEADEEHANKSAKQLEKENIPGITLRERLLLELQYFCVTGGHLDIKNYTLCSGSRFSDGGVPLVHWSSASGKLGVHWGSVEHYGGPFRAREVVSADGVPLKLNPCSLSGKKVKVELDGSIYEAIIQ